MLPYMNIVIDLLILSSFFLFINVFLFIYNTAPKNSPRNLRGVANFDLQTALSPSRSVDSQLNKMADDELSTPVSNSNNAISASNRFLWIPT